MFYKDLVGFSARAEISQRTTVRRAHVHNLPVGYNGVTDTRYPSDQKEPNPRSGYVGRRYRELQPVLGPYGEWPRGNMGYFAAANSARMGEDMRTMGLNPMEGLPPTRRSGRHAVGGNGLWVGGGRTIDWADSGMDDPRAVERMFDRWYSGP